MLLIKGRLLSVRLACRRLTGVSFPRRFPIAQFPNLPLIVAVLAGEAGKLLDGSAHSHAASAARPKATISWGRKASRSPGSPGSRSGTGQGGSPR